MIRFCHRTVRPSIRVCRVPKGRTGTLVTAGMIAGMIREGAKDFVVRQRAIDIFRQFCVPPKDRNGAKRVQGSGPDLGPIESGSR